MKPVKINIRTRHSTASQMFYTQDAFPQLIAVHM